MRMDPFREFDRMAQQLLGGRVRPAAMPIDAYRDGDRFVVHVDLPGVAADDIDVTVEKDVLTIAAERRWDASDDQRVVVSERPQGSFTRQLFLGEGLDTDRLEARHHDGVLTLTIPVAEQAKPRKVEINAGSRQMIEAGTVHDGAMAAV